MEVINNKEEHQFEIIIDGIKAELVYRLKRKTLFLLHTFVPEDLAGRGVATKLAEYALNYAKDNNRRLAVFCPFVSAYVKKHPEWFAYYDPKYHQGPGIPKE